MSELLSDINECDECVQNGRNRTFKTNELYLVAKEVNLVEILCVDCEADFMMKEYKDRETEDEI